MKRVDLLSLSVVTVVLSLAILVSTKVVTCAEANEPEASSQKMTEEEIRTLRSQFMARVSEEQDIEKQKERLIQNYLDLAALTKKQEALRDAYKAKSASLALEPVNVRRVKALQSTVTGLNEGIAADELFQGLTVRAYGLLQQLEQLEASLKSKAVTREEYRQEKRFLLDRLAQLDHLRQQMNQTDAIINKLEAISSEVSQLQK